MNHMFDELYFNEYTYNIYIYIIIILTSGYIIYETHYFQDIKKKNQDNIIHDAR